MSKLGRKVVFHLLTFDEGLNVLGDKGINEHYFLGESKSAFVYVRDNILKGRKPTINEVQNKFKIRLEKCDEGDIEYLTENVRKRYVNSKLNPLIEDAIKHIEDLEPEKAIKLLSQTGDFQKYLQDRTSLHSFKDDGDLRFEEYLETKHRGGILGIKAMWREINEACGGWVDGQFYVIAAFTNVGKTWSLCIIADSISKELEKDDTILVVSTEMQPKRVGRRIDCVKHKLNFAELRKGQLDDDDEDAWIERIADAKSNVVDYSDIVTVGKTDCKNVDDIKLLIKELKPSAVLIDGGYRLQPSKGKSQDWNKQVVVIEEIQDACIETNIPWIVTTQVGETDNKKSKNSSDSGSTYHGMKYAKEWMINPDNVFILRQDEDLKAENRMAWTNAKVRDGERVGETWQTHWNPEKTHYSDLEEDDIYRPAGQNSVAFNDDDDDDSTPTMGGSVV